MRARKSKVVVLALLAAGTLAAAAPHRPGVHDEPVLTIHILWSAPKQTPVFDCDDPDVRRLHPMQCPQPIDPFLGGGGDAHGGGGGNLGIIGKILRGLTGGLL